MTQQKDDLEAVRAVAAALEGFDANEQERIIRWTREKLGLSVSAQPTNPANQQQPLNPLSAAPRTIDAPVIWQGLQDLLC